MEALAGRHAAVEAGSPSGPLLWHTNHGRYLPGAPGPGRMLASAAPLAGRSRIPTRPGSCASCPEHRCRTVFRRDREPGDPAVTLCTFVADLTAGEAVVAARDEQPVAIPLPDLAEGHPHRQRQLASADSAG